MPDELAQKYAIYAHNLTRCYGQLTAVDHISFSIPTGSITGFLGINGAGKTTTIKMLSGLLRPTAGTAMVAGYDVVASPMEVKRRIGILLEEDGLYGQLAGREYLQFIATLRGMKAADIQDQIAGLLDTLDLTEKQNMLIAGYSKGMRRKLSLAAALIHRPSLLIVDEPFADIDALSISAIKTLLSDLRKSGTTILLCSHLLAVAQDVCSQIIIIQRGNIVADGDLVSLREKTGLGSAASLEDVFICLAQQENPVPAYVEG
jgi:ABC-2 type transport system ATP-binding protein